MNVFFVQWTSEFGQWAIEQNAEYDTAEQMMDKIEELSEDCRVIRVRTAHHSDPWKDFYRGE